MGKYEILAPTISQAFTDEEIEKDIAPVKEAVKDDGEVIVDVEPEITKEKIQMCAPYFYYWRKGTYPTDKKKYVGATYEEIANEVELKAEQVKKLHEEYNGIVSDVMMKAFDAAEPMKPIAIDAPTEVVKVVVEEPKEDPIIIPPPGGLPEGGLEGGEGTLPKGEGEVVVEDLGGK